MITSYKLFNFPSKGPYPRVVDITDDIKIFVQSSGVRNGIVNVQYRHTTGAVLVQENEPMLLDDIKKKMRELVPPEGDYGHNDIGGRRKENLCNLDDECANADAHIIATMLGGPIKTLNVVNGEVELGEWQRILLFDGDRDYGVGVMVLGTE